MKIQSAKFFLASTGNCFMTEIAQLFADGLQSRGVAAEMEFDEIPDLVDRPGHAQIVMAPHEYYPLFLERELSQDEITRVTQAVYFLTVEQPGSPWFEISYRYAQQAKGVFDINLKGVKEFQERGISVVHTPLGYSPRLEAAPTPHTTKPIDILFLGTRSDRRELFFSKYADFFNQYECRLILSRLEKPRLSTTPGFYTGTERNQLLATSKILINVHFGERTYFEWHRFLLAAANRCLMISEESDAITPLINGQHIVLSKLDDLPQACEYYLQQPNQRDSLAEQTYQFITQQLNTAKLCASLLNNLEKAEMVSYGA